MNNKEDIHYLIKDAIETIKFLLKKIPKTLCDAGISVCKLAEFILPDEDVIIIKLKKVNSHNDRCTVHIISKNGKVFSIQYFKHFLNSAYKVALEMLNEDGILISADDKIFN